MGTSVDPIRSARDVIALSVVCAVAALVVLRGRAVEPRARLRRVLSECSVLGEGRVLGEAAALAEAGRRRGPDGAVVAPLLAAVGVLVLAPWPWAPMIALVVVVAGPPFLGRLEPRRTREAREQRAQSMPLVLDLLAACWSAGIPPRRALEAVSSAIAGPLAGDLAQIAARMDLGASSAQAWSSLSIGPMGDELVRTLSDAEDGGIAPVPALRATADRLRDLRRRRGETAARAVAVRVTAPLGLCFLPAFIALGIAPAVLGALGPALS